MNLIYELVLPYIINEITPEVKNSIEAALFTINSGLMEDIYTKDGIYKIYNPILKDRFGYEDVFISNDGTITPLSEMDYKEVKRWPIYERNIRYDDEKKLVINPETDVGVVYTPDL